MHEFDKLVGIVSKLRGEEGCAWDKKQTMKTIITCLLEEAYEVVDAIDNDDMDSLQEELGDLMLQVVFLSQIANEKNQFNVENVLNNINDKLVRRHPHVFGDLKTEDTTLILKNWEKIKANEAKNKDRNSILDGIPKTLPALIKAYKIQEKAARVGFDWDNISNVIAKVHEELDELKTEIDSRHVSNNENKIQEELGDLIFSIVNLSRFFKIDPEISLNLTISKFYNRFNYIENKLKSNGKNINESNLEEMDKLWNEAKGKV